MYKLLDTFRSIFEGNIYLHRNSTHGDKVAVQLFEDLLTINRSQKLCDHIMTGRSVVNIGNKATGKKSRRGDGTFGERVSATTFKVEAGYSVFRGPIATIEIGTETKILSKAMIKQIDRVCGDLQRQAEEFSKITPSAIKVAIVGINQSKSYTSWEADRPYPTDGTAKARHPAQEAPEAERRIISNALVHFDHSIILRFDATNEEPYPFSWNDYESVKKEYSAMLQRISIDYDNRF